MKTRNSRSCASPKRKQPSDAKMVDLVLSEVVLVTLDGKPKRMTKREAFIHKLATDAIKGKATAQKLLTSLMERAEEERKFESSLAGDIAAALELLR